MLLHRHRYFINSNKILISVLSFLHLLNPSYGRRLSSSIHLIHDPQTLQICETTLRQREERNHVLIYRKQSHMVSLPSDDLKPSSRAGRSTILSNCVCARHISVRAGRFCRGSRQAHRHAFKWWAEALSLRPENTNRWPARTIIHRPPRRSGRGEARSVSAAGFRPLNEAASRRPETKA